MKVKQLIKGLEKNGFAHVRTHGDHRMFKKDGYPTISVPGNLNDDIKIGTLRSILKSARLSFEDL